MVLWQSTFSPLLVHFLKVDCQQHHVSEQFLQAICFLKSGLKKWTVIYQYLFVCNSIIYTSSKPLVQKSTFFADF